MRGAGVTYFAAYFFVLGYLAHKKQVPQKIAAAFNAMVDDMNRRSAAAFFDEAARRPAISLIDINGDSGH